MTLTLIECAACLSSAIFLSEFSILSAISCSVCSSCFCWDTNPGVFQNLSAFKGTDNKRLQHRAELNYLHLTLFCCHCHRVMAFVLIHHTQQTYELLISAAVNLHKFVVMATDAVFDPRRGLNQTVFFQWWHFKVRPQVSLTVRGQTHETEHGSCSFSHCAGVTLHISRCSRGVTSSTLTGCPPVFLQQGSQKGVPLQNRPREESLPALRAAVRSSQVIFPIPEGIDTFHTETVSTGSRHWILQQL